MFDYQTKRLLRARLYRLTHWEFWPRWALYWPIALHIVYLCIRYRSVTAPSVVNPGMPRSGILCESKSGLLESFSDQSHVAPHVLLKREDSLAERFAQAKAFISQRSPSYPTVLKPNSSERAEGVCIIRDERGLLNYLKVWESDVILQEYVPGKEYGVFYARYPDQEKGFIFSVVDKRLISVVGDGKRTLRQLILDDSRAFLLAEKIFFHNHRHRLEETPAPGETVRLVDVGSHCRGAFFLDGSHLITPELTEAVDRVSKCIPGFYFGRYDLRAPSEDDFRKGRNLKVIEVNGQPSEATHIYDPKHSWFYAVGTLRRQWNLSYKIGSINRRLGHAPMGLRKAFSVFAQWRRRVKSHARSFANLDRLLDEQRRGVEPETMARGRLAEDRGDC